MERLISLLSVKHFFSRDRPHNLLHSIDGAILNGFCYVLGF
jgi:hypothetical protein